MACHCKSSNLSSVFIDSPTSWSSLSPFAPSFLLCSLHKCVLYDPPPHIVQLLLAISPESLSHVDCLHRTPLHVAAWKGAKLSIIQLLADAYPDACSVQDVDGKTPLILLLENDCREATQDPPSIEQILTFIKAYPTSLLLEDNDGASALEHAILSEATIEVVKVLQHATAFMCATGNETSVERQVISFDQSQQIVVETKRTNPDTSSQERNIRWRW